MINCRQATRLLSEGEDRPLETAERLRLRLHLLTCRGCRNYRRQLHTLRGAIRAYLDDLRGRRTPGA